MMLSGGLVASTFLIYIACLFAIAFWGDRQTGEFGPRLRVWVYSLSIAVWCTSWTFFGAVGMAAGQIWDFLPIYIGPIILCFFGWRLIARMLAISEHESVASIADCSAPRYGKSQGVGVIIALICLISVLPYVALRHESIVLGFHLRAGTGVALTGGDSRGPEEAA